jgi:hypothetical protein
MPGKAYTPSGWEPDAHERWSGPTEIGLRDLNKDNARSSARRPGYATYKEIQEYRKRGESYILGHYSYEMMYDIYAGIEDKLVEGSIDHHLHIYPDYVPRDIDIIELAIEASKAKMDAIVCKDHFFPNVNGAWAAQWVVDQMVQKGELEKACKVLGTHILAWTYHPDQIHLIRKYPNLGYVFFPTMSGQVIRGAYAGPPMSVLNSKGSLRTDVKECIAACAEYKIPMASGHTGLSDPKSRMALVEYAHDVGCRFLVTHACGVASRGGISVEDMKAMAKLGAYLDFQANFFLPNMMHPTVDPNAIMDIARAVGPENNLVASTDFGQPTCESPIPAWKHFIRGMIHFGFSEDEIRLMVHTHPAKWLGLEA